MRRALPFAVCLLLAGCTTARRPAGGPPPPAATSSPRPVRATGLPPPTLQPSLMQLVGRVLAVDATTGTVIVDVYPFADFPPGPPGRVLVTRTADLKPTGRLDTSAYQRGQILGTHLHDGQPQVGDEVVLPPAPPP